MKPIAQRLVEALSHTPCQRIITKVEDHDYNPRPVYHMVSNLPVLGGAIAELDGLLHGCNRAVEVVGYAPADSDYSPADEDVIRIGDEYLVVTKCGSFRFKATVRHADYEVETDFVDFTSLMAAMNEEPGATLFYGDWSEHEKVDALEAFGLDVADEETA